MIFFYIFMDCFNLLILKIIFKNKKNNFNTFLNKKYQQSSLLNHKHTLLLLYTPFYLTSKLHLKFSKASFARGARSLYFFQVNS